MVSLYTTYFEKRYASRLCSCTTFFIALLVLLAVVIPYILSFITNNKWLKQKDFFEQPNVHFRNELILEALDDQGNSVVFSTVKKIQDGNNEGLLVPVVAVSSKDQNDDGLIDSIQVHIEMKASEQVQNVKVIGTFDYGLSKFMDIEMIGMMVVNIDTPNGASRILTEGELKLVQTEPIRLDSIRRAIYNVNPLDDYLTSSFFDILESYQSRKGKSPYCLSLYRKNHI